MRRKILVVVLMISVQTTFAQQAILNPKKLYHRFIKAPSTHILSQPVSDANGIKDSPTGRNQWYLPELCYLSIATIQPRGTQASTPSDLNTVDTNPLSRRLSHTTEIAPFNGFALPFLSYQLSDDCHLKLSGLAYSAQHHIRLTQAGTPTHLPTQSEPVTSIPKTPTKIPPTPSGYCSISRDLVFNVWAQDRSPSPNVQDSSHTTASSRPMSGPSTDLNEATEQTNPTQGITNGLGTQPIPSNDTIADLDLNNCKEERVTHTIIRYFGIGSTTEAHYTFLRPQPGMEVYWFPSIIVLYPFYDGIPATLSLSLGMGLRWTLNKKLTLDLSGSRTLTTWPTNQERRSITIGCQYTI